MRINWGIRAVFLIGFCLCCFPLLNNLLEQRRQEAAVATYQQAAEQEKEAGLSGLREKAEEYNTMLYQSDGAVVDKMDTDLLSDESYKKQLDVSGTGMMGSIDIPKINVDLPIYHGTGEDALSNGVGHIQGTSLPVGGENTHSVLTGHRGLPRSKLFVRLDEMKEGDLIFVRASDQTMAYKVSDIQTVKPDNMSGLTIKRGKDLLSLVTCTPYGINTHRLIVTGKRVEYQKAEHENIRQEIPSGRELLFTALPFVFVGLVTIIYIKDRRNLKDADFKI